jgi:hypothetical protein
MLRDRLCKKGCCQCTGVFRHAFLREQRISRRVHASEWIDTLRRQGGVERYTHAHVCHALFYI